MKGGSVSHQQPEQTLAALLARLLRLLPHNGAADLFTSALVLGLGFTVGVALVLYSIGQAARLLSSCPLF